MTNSQIHECAGAVMVLALHAPIGEDMEKQAADMAMPTAGVGALGAGALGAGLGYGLTGLLSGTPKDDEEEARLKNRKRLAALALGIPGAALGGYLGHQLGSGAGSLDEVLKRVSPEAIKGYIAKMREDPEAVARAQAQEVARAKAHEAASAQVLSTIGAGVSNPDADEISVARSLTPPDYNAMRNHSRGFLAGVGGSPISKAGLDRVNSTTQQAINNPQKIAPPDPSVRDKVLEKLFPGRFLNAEESQKRLIRSLTHAITPDYDAGKNHAADFLDSVGGANSAPTKPAPHKPAAPNFEALSPRAANESWNTAGMPDRVMHTRMGADH